MVNLKLKYIITPVTVHLDRLIPSTLRSLDKQNTNQEWLITWEREVVHDTNERQEQREHRRMHGYGALVDKKENAPGKEERDWEWHPV